MNARFRFHPNKKLCLITQKGSEFILPIQFDSLFN
jgi:hypothetical protein